MSIILDIVFGTIAALIALGPLGLLGVAALLFVLLIVAHGVAHGVSLVVRRKTRREGEGP